MNTETIRQIASRTADRLDTDSVAEFIGALTVAFLTLWGGFAGTLYAATFLPWDELATTVTLAESLFIGVIIAGIAFPALVLSLLFVYDRWTARGYDITPAIAILSVAATLHVAAILYMGETAAANSSLDAPAPLLELAFFGFIIAITAIGTILAVLAFRQAIGTVGRQHVAVGAVVILCVALIATGVGAALLSLNDSEVNGIDDRDYTYTHEQYDELSKWDTALAGIAHDETTIRQNTTGAAMYTCDDQPSAVTLDAVAGRPAAETTVAPEKLHLTLYETTNGTRIYAQFDAEFAVEGEHMRNRESQGVSIVPEVASPAYWGQGGRMLMQNTESIIVVSDYLTEDGEVHRYGARLCRPDVE